jgi:hypothetical protein
MGNFISAALNSEYGGSWSNGAGHLFASDSEAFAAGSSYNFQHNSWSNTYYGSYENSTVGFAALTGLKVLLSPEVVQSAIDKMRGNSISNSPLIACSEPNCTHGVATQQGSDFDPWNMIKQSHWLMLRIALHNADAISVSGNINMIPGFGTDLVHFQNTSLLKVLSGPDAGQTTGFQEIPIALGWDLSAGVNFTEYYYVAFGDQPLQLSDFKGFRISISGGFGMWGVDESVSLTYAPLGNKGFYVAVSRFIGGGDPGPSLNVNWGDTNFR